MSGARVLCGVLFAFCVLWFIGCSADGVYSDYDYSKNVDSYWALSDKASTLQQKSVYLDAFCNAVEHAGLADYNALFLTTPNNSTEQNLVALHSLQERMHEIIAMDPTSFAYQTAIQQITAQEQGEAKAMLGEFEGAWYKAHHFLLWEWVGVLHCFVILIGLVGFGILTFSEVLE